MNRLQEIEARLAAIVTALEAPDADIDTLEKEVNDLKTERKALMDKAEKRRALLGSIAGGQNGTVIASFEERQAPTQPTDVRGTPEYRSGWLKGLMGLPLTDAERRSVAATNVAGAIPTQTANEIITKVKQYAPLLNEITLLHVAGNLKFAIEGTNNAAALHTENAAVTPSADTLVTVTLGGYEIVKVIRISATVATMTVNAFETWLVDLLAENIAMKIVGYLVTGTGSGQPEGVEKANTWGAGNSISVALAGTLTAANVMDLIALLKGGYHRNAKFLMKTSTLFGDFMKLRDDAKYPLVQYDQAIGAWRIMGYIVMLDDNVGDHEAYFGDFKKIVGNLAEDINVASSAHSAFANNSIDYRGAAIFDSKVAVAEAFVKLVKAAS